MNDQAGFLYTLSILSFGFKVAMQRDRVLGLTTPTSP